MTTAETSTALSVNAASLGTPKYGTVIPNRIFVGGIAANTTEQELKDFFSAYGAVKDSKIIADRAGVSKGYGFITFETQEDAEKIIKKESDSLMFKERKLNIGPAVRKQQAFPRLYDPNLPASILFSQNTVPYTFPNSVAFFHGQEGSVYPSNIPMQTPPAAAYQGPVVMPQAAGQHSAAAVYVQPYAAYATPTSPTAATPAQYMYPAMQFTSEYPEMMGTMAQYQPEMIEAAAQEYRQ